MYIYAGILLKKKSTGCTSCASGASPTVTTMHLQILFAGTYLSLAGLVVLIKRKGVLTSDTIILEISFCIGLGKHFLKICEQDALFLIIGTGLILDLLQVHALSPLWCCLSFFL